MMNQPNTRQAIQAEIASARSQFHALLDSLSDSQLRQRSNNPGWNNGEILFHMTLGFALIPLLFPLLKVFYRLPRGCSKAYADFLNLITPFFNFANAMAARIGGKIYGRRSSLHKKYDQIYKSLDSILDSMDDEELSKGMYYPNRWDDLFDRYMTTEKLFRYPIRHFTFHIGQISK
jgi:uncharacterized damage-inducible protein DinB